MLVIRMPDQCYNWSDIHLYDLTLGIAILGRSLPKVLGHTGLVNQPLISGKCQTKLI